MGEAARCLVPIYPHRRTIDVLEITFCWTDENPLLFVKPDFDNRFFAQLGFLFACDRVA